MTNLQIQYRNLQEKIRNDQAIEDETQRHNRAVENVSTDQTAEAKRHNLAMESLQTRANEIESWRVSLQQALNESNMRMNELRVAEEQRHNLVTEQNAKYVAELQSRTSMYGSDNALRGTMYSAGRSYAASVYGTDVRAQTALTELSETQRHNIVAEGISETQARSGVAGAVGSLLSAGARLIATLS